METEYLEWKNKPTPANTAKIVNKFSGLLHFELPKYMGKLPAGVIKSYGKSFIIDSLNTYNPDKGKLANHIVNNLQRLNRINYETSSAVRMSEELQMGINMYKRAKEDLEARFHRDPTDEELSQELGWSISKVLRVKKQFKPEVLSGSLESAPAFIQMEDPVIDYLYHDLDPKDKMIFQHRTGYRGNPILGVTEIAKRIHMSPATVSNKAMKIAKTLKNVIGEK